MAEILNVNRAYKHWLERWSDAEDNWSCETYDNGDRIPIVNLFRWEVKTCNEQIKAGNQVTYWREMKAGLRKHYDEWRAAGKKDTYFLKFIQYREPRDTSYCSDFSTPYYNWD